MLFVVHGVCVHKSIQLNLLQIESWNEHDPLLDPSLLRLSYVVNNKCPIPNHIKNSAYIEIREYSLAEHSLSFTHSLMAIGDWKHGVRKTGRTEESNSSSTAAGYTFSADSSPRYPIADSRPNRRYSKNRRNSTRLAV